MQDDCEKAFEAWWDSVETHPPCDVWRAAWKKSRAAMGRKAGAILGSKGGKARAEKMTAEQRSESARTAIKVRWKKRDDLEASRIDGKSAD